MIRAAATLLAPRPHLLMTLLLSAAGFSALAQVPEAASAPAVTVAPAASAPRPKPVQPPVSALAPAPTWKELTPAQRTLLAPLEGDWAKFSPTQRSKWQNATPMMASLPPAELARLHERMRDWAQLSPAERRDARVAFQVAKQVDAEQRQAKWEAYQALPPEKRQELAEKAAARRKAQANARPPKPAAAEPKSKSNTVPAAPKLVAPTAVTGSLLQAKPGASTVLITRAPSHPSYQAAGQAKLVADPSLVNPKTLLPKSLKAPAASEPRR